MIISSILNINNSKLGGNDMSELTNNEAALIYAIIGHTKAGKSPTVEEALALFDPKPKKKKAESVDEALDMLNSEQLSLF